MSVLDQTTDPNGQRLVALLNTVGADGNRLFPAPDFVKSAGAEKIAGGPDPAPGSYANPRDRRFPCHTAPATWVSAVFFHTQKAAMDRRLADLVERRIDAAAAHHGIGGEVARVKAAAAAAGGAAEADLPDADFALVVRYDGGATERHLPLRNPAEVKAAAGYLQKYAAEFTFRDRRAVAEKILAKADALGADLGEDAVRLEKQAGHGTCAPEVAADLLFGRAKAVRLLRRDLDAAEGLAKMAQLCLARPADAVAPANLWKLAEVVDDADRKYGLGRLTDLPRPEDVLFDLTIKVARQTLADHVPLTSGTVYAKAALARVNLEDVKDVMGAGFADAVAGGGLWLDAEKLAEVAPTMPRDDAELFDRLMATLRVAPAYKQAAAAPTGPLAAADALVGLAGLYPG